MIGAIKSKIRKARVRDASVIASFNCALALETEGRSLEPARALRGVLAALRSRQKAFYLVAELEGAVAGQLMVTYEWSDWRNATFWWLQSVYVHPDHRRRGIFRALFEHLAAEARRRRDVCGLRLYVERDNRRAAKVYRRLGLEKPGYEVMEIDYVL